MDEQHDYVIQYRINQMTDTGLNVSLALTEDVELEEVSQQQQMLDAIDNVLTDKEVKEQIKPFLEADLTISTTNSYQYVLSNFDSDYYA